MRCWQVTGKIRYMMRQEKTGKIVQPQGLGSEQLRSHLKHRLTSPIVSSVEVSAKLLNEVANHYVYAFPPYCELKLNTGSRIAWKRPER